MKLIRKAGDTSVILQVFIQDSSSTVGAGLAGLTNASSGLTAYYHRDTDTTATAISLVTMTVGTFTSSGFKEIDATNMPGWYQFCPPNAALATGSKSVALHLKGATNMAPLPIEVQLVAGLDVEDANALGMARLDAAISSRMATYTQPTGFLAATFPAGTIANTTNITAAAGIAVASNADKTGYSIAAGGLDSTGITAAAQNAIADAVLDRDMATGTDTGTDTGPPTAAAHRTVRQALRASRNKQAIAAGTLTVYKEDDSTASWTAAITTTAGNPISTVDPTT